MRKYKYPGFDLVDDMDWDFKILIDVLTNPDLRPITHTIAVMLWYRHVDYMHIYNDCYRELIY